MLLHVGFLRVCGGEALYVKDESSGPTNSSSEVMHEEATTVLNRMVVVVRSGPS